MKVRWSLLIRINLRLSDQLAVVTHQKFSGRDRPAVSPWLYSLLSYRASAHDERSKMAGIKWRALTANTGRGRMVLSSVRAAVHMNYQLTDGRYWPLSRVFASSSLLTSRNLHWALPSTDQSRPIQVTTAQHVAHAEWKGVNIISYHISGTAVPIVLPRMTLHDWWCYQHFFLWDIKISENWTGSVGFN